MIEQHKPYEGLDAWVTIAQGSRASGMTFHARSLRLTEPIPEGWQNEGYASMAIYSSPQGVGPGTKEAVVGSRWVWVDLDVYKTGKHPDLPIAYTKEQAFEALRDGPMMPSFIIDSGGGLYGWWLLDELCTDSALVEGANHWLADCFKQYAGDHGSAACNHVLRYPGSVNLKNGTPRPCTILLSSGLQYSISSFTISSRVRGYTSSNHDPEPLPENFERLVKYHRPRLWEQMTDLQAYLKREGAKTHEDGTVDNHRYVSSIAFQLMSAPFMFSDGIIRTVLSHPEWPCGLRYHNKSGESGWNDINRTIEAEHDFITGKQLLPDANVEVLYDDRAFSPAKARDRFLARYNIGRYQGNVMHYDTEKNEYVDINEDYFVEQILGNTIGDRYKSGNSDEVKKQLLSYSEELEDEGSEWISLRNRLVNLRTGKDREHGPDIFLARRLPVLYGDPDKYALEELDTVIDGWFGVNTPLWWEFSGHILTRELLHLGFLLIYGLPKTGKSQPVILLEHFLGPKNYCAIDFVEFASRDFALANLRNVLANLKSEAGTDEIVLSTGALKTIAAGESLETGAKYEQKKTTKITAKSIFCANHLLRVKKDDEGWYRRMYAVPFKGKQWSEKRPGFVSNIGAKLGSRHEILTAYFFRSMEALMRLRQHEYTETDDVREARGEMRYNSDTVLRYWKDRVKVNDEYSENTQFLFDDYWETTSSKDHNYPLSKGAFLTRTEELMSLGLIPKFERKNGVDTRLRKNSLIWVGCEIVEPSLKTFTTEVDGKKITTFTGRKQKGA